MKTSILFGHGFKERAYLPNEQPDPTNPANDSIGRAVARWLHPYIQPAHDSTPYYLTRDGIEKAKRKVHYPAVKFPARIRLGSWEFPVFGGVASSVLHRGIGRPKGTKVEAVVLRPEDVETLIMLDRQVEDALLTRRLFQTEAAKRGRPLTVEDCVNADEAKAAK